MRKLYTVASVALAAAALSLPSGASAQTADTAVCTPLVPCAVETVRNLLVCAGSCVPGCYEPLVNCAARKIDEVCRPLSTTCP